MKSLLYLAILCCAALLLNACGESTTDEPLPEGTAPNDPPADRAVGTDVTLQPMTEQPVLEPESGPEPEVTTRPPLPLPVAEDDAERSQAPGISYVLPEGWTAVMPTDPGAMRLATLVPPAGFDQAELAVFSFQGDVGGFALNVNRWAGMIGRPPIGGLMTAAASDFEKFDIDGTQATWIPLMNEGTNLAILSVWIPIGENPETPDHTWTLKLTCKADQVQKLAPAVRAWCASIRFE